MEFTGERFIPEIDNLELQTEHMQRYLSVGKAVKDKIVLDIACGEGYGTDILAREAKEAIGIDISAEAVNHAKNKYKRDNLSFKEGSIADIPMDDKSVDIIVSFETIEHVSEELQNQFITEAKRVLKEDGILIISTPNKLEYTDKRNIVNEFHVKEFYYDEFIEFLGKEFSNFKVYNQVNRVVSVLSSDTECEKELKLFGNTQQNVDGKYYIVCASNSEIQIDGISSVYIGDRDEYSRLKDRILVLQDEEEDRNRHIKYLDGEIEEKNGYIRILQKESEEFRNDKDRLYRENELIREENARLIVNNDRINDSNDIIKSENERVRAESECVKAENERVKAENELVKAENVKINKANEILKYENEVFSGENARLTSENSDLMKENERLSEENKKYQQEVQESKQSILNKQGHIELLLEKEREYEREKNSRTYRLANKFRKISLFFFPVNSKRRFFAHLFVHALRHPILTLKMINGRRIKNCFIILKKEGVSSAIHHFNCVEEYVKQGTISTEKLDVVEVKSEPNKKFEEYEHISFTKFKNPRVSIVIPVYNQFDYTYNCLASILRNSGDCTYEIIIANDCSTDHTTRLSELVDNINVVTNKTNLRFLRNCNNAAKQAKGEFILFLNNDTQVQPDWLKPLFDLMDKDSKVGMVGSKLIYADGSLQEAGGILWDDGSAWNYGNRKNPEESDFSYVKEADYISGAAIMIRKSLWKEIGGFDDRFAPAYCEDSDLAFEVRKHGYKVMLQPLSLVVHFEGISNGTDVNAGQKKYQIDNQQKFLEKWGEELKKNHFPNGTNVYVARDRSKDKKHILVIDHYVPQYDKDAGSKTTFMYLKMFVQKGYHVTFLGDNFYRHEPYTTELQQMGIMVLYGPYYAQNWESWLSENIDVFDIFYLNRPHISVKYIDFIKERARGKIIYYGHDLHFLRNRREYELTGDEAKLKESEEWKEKELYLMKRADMNYYPSATEEVAIHEIDKRIPVKAITAYVYEEFPQVLFDGKKREGLLFVGGFGHDPNLDAVKWFLDRIFPKVYERIQAPFYIVGSKAPKELTELKEPGVIVKGFVSEEELAELYSNCRLCVVPLRYGAGVKGKVVEAIYNAIPIVTTSVGAEGIVGIEEFTEVKDTEEELIDAICDTYTDEKKLKSMSEMSQKYIKEHFSTDAVWSVIEEDFK